VARVCLTFDNGPTEVTPAVLDSLARRGLRATFFVVGRLVATPEGRALAARARAAGHRIGNHTHSHATPLGHLSAADARAEIALAEAAIGDLAHAPRLFRPFGEGGHADRRLLNGAARDHLIAGGYTCVLWDAVPHDWDDPEGWVDRALAMVRATPSSVLVLHDIPAACGDRLDGFLDRLLDEGHSVVQDAPDHCVPLRAGIATADLERYVTDRRGP
jgi:peptidoglycan/xylan/chitin deacetylase (PgdA/CDA1 family)